MMTNNSTENRKNGNSPIESEKSSIKTLYSELLRLSLESDNLPHEASDEESEAISERQWAIAAQIDTTPARSHDDVTWKCSAMHLMGMRDPDFDCHVPGAPRNLALSIAADMLRLACLPKERAA